MPYSAIVKNDLRKTLLKDKKPTEYGPRLSVCKSVKNEQLAYIGLGGNMGDIVAHFQFALNSLDCSPGSRVTRVSPLYLTPPFGVTNQPDFINAVAEIRTSLPVESFFSFCLKIEDDLNRVRTQKWGPRPLDIDILLFGGKTFNTGKLQIPHPRMLERVFVLKPLADIASHLNIAGRRVSSFLSGLNQPNITRLPLCLEKGCGTAQQAGAYAFLVRKT